MLTSFKQWLGLNHIYRYIHKVTKPKKCYDTRCGMSNFIIWNCYQYTGTFFPQRLHDLRTALNYLIFKGRLFSPLGSATVTIYLPLRKVHTCPDSSLTLQTYDHSSNIRCDNNAVGHGTISNHKCARTHTENSTKHYLWTQRRWEGYLKPGVDFKKLWQISRPCTQVFTWIL